MGNETTIQDVAPRLVVYVECSCSRRYTPARFAQLEQRGVQRMEGAGPDLVLANCSCGSTIALEADVELAGTLEVRRLSAADLLRGIANVPLRIVAEDWVEENGAPDALWVALSNGREFTFRHDPRTGSRFPECSEHETEIDPLATGIGAAQLAELEVRLATRYAEDVGQVSR